MKTILPFLAAAYAATAAPITIVNHSGEINNGVDRTPISDPSVIGWSGTIGQVINDFTDYGNGGWRMSFEDSEDIYQMTSHVIESGASYSLRFDAAMFAGSTPDGGGFTPDLTLVAPGTRNGGFEADVTAADGRTFAETPEWFNFNGNDASQATRNTPANLAFVNRNAVLSAQAATRQFAIDTGHDLATGESFQATISWIDASNWNDASDRIRVSLYTTSDDTPGGTPTVIQALLSTTSAANGAYQTEPLLFSPVPGAFNGKRLFAMFEGADGNGDSTGFARLDNFTLERGTPDVVTAPRELIAELYIDDNGTRAPVATRTYAFKTPIVGIWDHYHLAVPAGTLDAHETKTIGVRFRSNDGGDSNFQSVDNVRLDFWTNGEDPGDFVDTWNSTPNQVWIGPGYWANRLHDWQVNNGRVNCILGSRDRRTLHRVGTTIRGNGANFSLSVRTGLHAGANNSASKTGILIGAGPNLDWRGALLVHDGLGRDFGLFLGLTNTGAVVIDDLSTGSVSQSAAGAVPPGGFPAEARLDLDAVYLSATGEYTLTISAHDTGNTLLSTASLTVPSDRVLGSLGLLSHKGANDARFWFDDFTGTGDALHPESDRHLAILGAMHTLSRGTLKLTAQLSPLDLAATPTAALDTWNGASWRETATTPIDQSTISAYTATFKIPDWNDTVDTLYRVRVTVGGSTFHWSGTIRRDPVDKNEIVIAATTGQRVADGGVQNNGFDWSPVRVWHPHVQTYTNLASANPDVFAATGDQVYEGQPTPEDSGTDFNRQHDYLYKWLLWVLQVRDITKDVPTVALPDDHDIYQGNLWGEGGIATGSQNSGGYEEPASWVRMVERSQTSHFPDPDPYNPVQPAPTIAQGIGVYFTGMVYGRVGIAIIEDRKFKTGKDNPPANPEDQFLLGDRQMEFLRHWATDWDGQDIKTTVSQSPFGNLHTHASSGYGFSLNDKDTHGWPLHRRNETWELLRRCRMFQIAGDQHLATVAHHGITNPRDAGYSFSVPAVSNFFPRCWDPVHNSGGKTSTVSPYLGDFFFDGNGTLPSGEPNLTANDPAHVAMLAAGNPLQYYNQTRGISPANLHDRGAGYGIVRIDKTTRNIVFECWPVHADPEFPQTGSQFPDWPVTISQTDNDGRTPTGFLPVIDTHWRKKPVIRVYDETTGDLVYAMRIRGNLFRPPVYDNGTTYRVEISYDDDPVSETLAAQSATPAGAAVIHSFTALQPSIIAGNSATLGWNVESPATLTIDHGLGNVLEMTVNGIGYVEVTPATDTTYTLTLNGSQTATTTVRVFPGRANWNAAHFSSAELAQPAVSGNDADPDGDGFTNEQEFQFQTNPRSASSRPELRSRVTGDPGSPDIEFTAAVPLESDFCTLGVESSSNLTDWTALPANSFIETGRDHNPIEGTSRITVRLNDPLPAATPTRYYRSFWILN